MIATSPPDRDKDLGNDDSFLPGRQNRQNQSRQRTGFVMDLLGGDGGEGFALAQAIGEVLVEEIRHDAHGQPLTINLMEYELPRAADLMPLRIEAMLGADARFAGRTALPPRR